jgi:hypothetical protein
LKSRKYRFPIICLAALAIWSAAAVWFFYAHGWLLYFGDAEAHLNTARRMVDSQTPGYEQLGRIWLPLPHILMLPLVRIDGLWRSGLAGAVPSALSFVVAGAFLFGAVRRLFDSTAAAAVSTALFATNPNLLYLQSTAMGEAVFFACLMAVLYASVRFRQSPSGATAAGAGLACALGTLVRYEGWFLIPFVAGYLLLTAGRRQWWMAALFSMVAALGPAWWLAHNWWIAGDPFDFYRGPGSALAIQHAASYPGHENWRLAWQYFRTAARLCAGIGLTGIGLGGILAALGKRAFWPLLLLALPGVFYLWSMHSAATPIFVPNLWPNSYYNTRYGLAVLPLLALGGGALVVMVPGKGRAAAAGAVILAGILPWLIHPSPESWITWKESQVNSEGRRQWTQEAADFLKSHYVRGSGILTTFGDLTAIFREAGIPLRETFTEMNGVPFEAAVTRPDLFLWQEWAVVEGGDAAQSGVNRAGRYAIHYRLEKRIVAKREPVIEIYRRI